MSYKRFGPPIDMVTQWDAAGGVGWTPRKDVEAVGGMIEQPDERPLLITIDSTRTPHRIVEAGATMTIAFSSDVAWSAKSFSVPEEICRHFKLMSLRCARVEYVPSEGIDCSIFSDAQCVTCRKQIFKKLNISWPTVFPGTALGVVVTNASDVPVSFRGTFEAVPARCL